MAPPKACGLDANAVVPCCCCCCCDWMGTLRKTGRSSSCNDDPSFGLLPVLDAKFPRGLLLLYEAMVNLTTMLFCPLLSFLLPLGNSRLNLISKISPHPPPLTMFAARTPASRFVARSIVSYASRGAMAPSAVATTQQSMRCFATVSFFLESYPLSFCFRHTVHCKVQYRTVKVDPLPLSCY